MQVLVDFSVDDLIGGLNIVWVCWSVGVAFLIHVRLVEIVRVMVCTIREHGTDRRQADYCSDRCRGNDGFDIGKF